MDFLCSLSQWDGVNPPCPYGRMSLTGYLNQSVISAAMIAVQTFSSLLTAPSPAGAGGVGWEESDRDWSIADR
jgi:hypothetical protein